MGLCKRSWDTFFESANAGTFRTLDDFLCWLYAKVNPHTFLPTNAILTTSCISLILSLIAIGSEEALENILSFTASSWEAAASIPLALLLWRRITRRIENRKWPDFYSSTMDVTSGPVLVWGPWRVPEPFGTVVNAIGLAWITLAFFFSF